MNKVKLTITSSNCRCGYVKEGDTFIVDDLCPPLCHELWNYIYPSVYALKNGATLDYGAQQAICFDANCPDEGLVQIHGEVIEDGVEAARWELHDAMFSVDHMLKKVHEYASSREMVNTLQALRLMEEYHKGAFRKGAEKVPYIIHPLMLACHAFALGIADDILIPACLLHDVLEDTNAKPEDLNMPAQVIEVVQLVSFNKDIAPTKEEAKAIYYERISQNKVASMVKLLDRCNNISTMATGFSRVKMADYIDETEKYVLPLLNKVKRGHDEYYNAAFLLKYQMRSILESLKRTL